MAETHPRAAPMGSAMLFSAVPLGVNTMSAAPTGESWGLLQTIQLIATILMPIALLWIGLVAKDRREHSRAKLSDIERQIREMKDEVRESRMEMREGRKECAEDVRAIAAQISEYPRRREMQEAIAQVWQEIRSGRSNR